MADTFRLRVVTPSEQLADAQVTEVVAPGARGGFGVRPGHTPFLTTLDAGPLRFQLESGELVRFAVVDGFVEVNDDGVVVLAEEAIRVEDIDVEAEQRAISEARARMAGHAPSSDEYRSEAATIRRAAARSLAVRG